MRNKKREINGTDPTLAGKKDEFVFAKMVDEIRNQKRAGHEEGRNHAFFVDFRFAGPDGDIATGQKNGAGAIESSVQCRVREHFVCRSLLRLEMKQIRIPDIRNT